VAMFNHKKFTRSVLHAVRGFRYVLGEQNFRVQVASSLVVIFFVLFFGLRVWEAVALVMMIILVLVLEIINSIFERVMDILEPRVHPYAKIIKDMMAAAVLIASIGAVFVGVVIFWPYFVNLYLGGI
jgi:diacylglycerol kinase